MPDLFTHFALGYYISKLNVFAGLGSVFVLGNILPDLFTRAMGILFSFLGLSSVFGMFFLFTHTPFGLLFFVYLLSFLFEEEIRFKVFITMLLGSFLHLFLDTMQGSFYYSLDFLLFPFSFQTFSLNLFYYNDTTYIAPFLLIFFLIGEYREYRIKKADNAV